MDNSKIGFHLDPGERPEVRAHRHSHDDGGWVAIGGPGSGGLAIHGRFEDLAATLTAALTAVSGLMVDDLLATFDQPEADAEAVAS